MGLISGRKAFQKPMNEGAALLHAVQDGRGAGGVAAVEQAVTPGGQGASQGGEEFHHATGFAAAPREKPAPQRWAQWMKSGRPAPAGRR